MNAEKTKALLVRGGRVYDSSAARFERMDLLCRDGRIEKLGLDLTPPYPAETIDAQGQMVLPGLFDFHTHLYWGGTPLGVNPEKLLASSGVFTFLDFGSAGAANFEGFYHHVIKPSKARIYALLNLSLIGLAPITKSARRFGELSDTRLMDVGAAVETARAYPEIIRGIKIRLGPGCSGEWGTYALSLARRIADRLSLPLAVHATEAPPFLDEVLDALGPDDILTHCYCHDPFNRIFDEHGNVRDFVVEAQRRGVKFDLGHGVSNFTFGLASDAVSRGFVPDFISSDVHAYNIDGPVHDLPTTLSKMVSAGLTLEQALHRSTAAPAAYLGVEDDLVQLREGGAANFSIAEWRESELIDSVKETVRAGRLQIAAVYQGGVRIELPDDGRPEGKRK